LRRRLLLFSCPVRYSSSTSDPPAFRYHAAASVSGKTDSLDLARNTYPYPYRREGRPSHRKPWPPAGGHDAFFLSDAPGPDGRGGALAVGVADGVGGWVDSGVNPADFSRRLCRNMARAAACGVADKAGQGTEGVEQRRRMLHPVEVLEDGFQQVLVDRSVWAGGSTACVAVASPEGVVEVAKYVPNTLCRR
jgi:protein phosphatase PTC7